VTFPIASGVSPSLVAPYHATRTTAFSHSAVPPRTHPFHVSSEGVHPASRLRGRRSAKEVQGVVAAPRRHTSPKHPHEPQGCPQTHREPCAPLTAVLGGSPGAIGRHGVNLNHTRHGPLERSHRATRCQPEPHATRTTRDMRGLERSQGVQGGIESQTGTLEDTGLRPSH
jgi:hypothetical protein